MVKITKEYFYSERGKTYLLEDKEAVIRYRKAVEWININDNCTIYEVGCKFSIIRDLLENFSKKYEYVAVDIDEETLKKIPDYDSKSFICHNVNTGLPFNDNSADYIVCLEVMEHLENATYFFEEVYRVLKPNGFLILSVPNPYSWMEFYDNFTMRSDTEGHISTYTYQNIDALAQFCGFNMVSQKGTFTKIPFSSRFFKAYKYFETDNIFLTRSNLFLLQKLD